jgi:40-residue YVTN family beta-propeller repeat
VASHTGPEIILMKRFIHTMAAQILLAAMLIQASVLTTSAQSDVPKPGARATVGKAGGARKNIPVSLVQKFEKEGVAIQLSLQSLPDEMGRNNGLIHGADAIATFRLTDARTGQPLTGLHPAAWFNTNPTGRAPNEAECQDKIRTFSGGLLSTRADVDLNNYLLLTLNHDRTITFINPQVSFSKTKLESIIELPGTGVDWALSDNKNSLYVTLPEQSAVAVINTITKKLVSTLSIGEKTKPMRLALEPGGRNVWVGLDGSASVAAIDTASNKLAAIVEAGAGLHNIAFTADGRFAYVTNSDADTVSVIDIKKFVKVADIKVGKTPVPVAYSSASGLIYVAAINGESISAIDPAKQQVVATIPVKRGVVALRFEPKGRFGFVVNQVASTVSVLDSATNTINGETAVVKQPDQVVFTPGYAYLRGTDSEKISLIDLTLAATGKLSPVEVTAGRLPPSKMPQEIGVSDMIVPTPEGNAVMIANAPDQMIYYYVEGMMAPMGTLTNYKRRPLALLLLDRSLSETEPGVYSTLIKLPRAGHYDVPFFLSQPRVVNCFQVDIAESPDGAKNPANSSIAVEFLFKGKQFKPLEEVPLRIKLTDSITKQPIAGLKDVQVLVFEPPGIWQQRQFASEVEPGVYEITQGFPHAGAFRVMLNISSRAVSFADLPSVMVAVENAAQAGE